MDFSFGKYMYSFSFSRARWDQIKQAVCKVKDHLMKSANYDLSYRQAESFFFGALTGFNNIVITFSKVLTLCINSFLSGSASSPWPPIVKNCNCSLDKTSPWRKAWFDYKEMNKETIYYAWASNSHDFIHLKIFNLFIPFFLRLLYVQLLYHF